MIHVERAGQEMNHRIKQELHALVLVRRTAEHRDGFHFQAAQTQTFDDVLFRKIAVLEIFFHQLVAAGSRFFQKLRAVFVGKRLHVRGNRLLSEILSEVVVVNFRFHTDKVDNTAEIRFFTDGQFDGNGVGAEALFNHSFHTEEIRAVDVHLVHVRDAGNLVGIRLAPYGFGLRLNAALRAERSHRAVENAERTLHFHREVHVARGIDDVETVSFPDTGGSGGSNRNAALLLLHHPVHRGGAFVHFADLVCFTRIEQDTLGGRRLSGVDVRHNTEVSGVL